MKTISYSISVIFILIITSNSILSNVQLLSKDSFRDNVGNYIKTIQFTQHHINEDDNDNIDLFFERFIRPIYFLDDSKYTDKYLKWYKDSIDAVGFLPASSPRDRLESTNNLFFQTAKISFSVLNGMSTEEISNATSSMMNFHDYISKSVIEKFIQSKGTIIGNVTLNEWDKLYIIKNTEDRNNVFNYEVRKTIDSIRENRLAGLNNIFITGKLISDYTKCNDELIRKKSQEIITYIFDNLTQDGYIKLVSPQVDLSGIINAAESCYIIPDFDVEKDISKFFTTSGAATINENNKFSLRQDLLVTDMSLLENLISKVKHNE